MNTSIFIKLVLEFFTSVRYPSRPVVYLLVTQKDDNWKIVEIMSRARFFLRDCNFVIMLVGEKSDFLRLEKNYICCLGEKNKLWLLKKHKFEKGVSNLDYDDNHNDGWEWHYIAYRLWLTKNHTFDKYKTMFDRKFAALKKMNLNKAYIFGTGPSLTKVSTRNWDDGYRIVCNTIVRDQKTWKNLNPHIIVAADTIYHFGHTKFARKFRQDLKSRLAESSVVFVYPIVFHWLVEREFSEFSDRLIPIPIGAQKTLLINFYEDFELPGLGNVLPLMLLPLASYLSKNVFMWGFDGKGPKDKLFWKNSTIHTYDNLMLTLQKAHPAFFKFHVPTRTSKKYIEQYQGDELDKLMQDAEKKGWKYTMLHKSWTPTLSKRFKS